MARRIYTITRSTISCQPGRLRSVSHGNAPARERFRREPDPGNHTSPKLTITRLLVRYAGALALPTVMEPLTLMLCRILLLIRALVMAHTLSLGTVLLGPRAAADNAG